MKTYLVIGIWDNDGGRWADSFDALTPKDAEDQAHSLYGAGLEIAGVVWLNDQGEMEVVA